MSKTILITGGAGFIGYSLMKRLVAAGKKVRVLDSLEQQIHGDSAQQEKIAAAVAQISDFHRGDIRSEADVTAALEGVDVVVHLAAETGTGQSMYQISRYFDSNVQGTANLLECIGKQGDARPRSLVLASSRAVYGDGAHFCHEHGLVFPKTRAVEDLKNGFYALRCPHCRAPTDPVETEETATPNCISIYALTKYAQEQMCLIQGAALGMPVLACRLQNVYGPGQSLKNPYTGIISIFASRIFNENPIMVFEDGEPQRDFVFVEDVVDVFVKAIEQGWSGCEVVNVGTGRPSTVMQVATLLQQFIGKSTRLEVSGEFRQGDIRCNFASGAKLSNLFGITPSTTLEDGLERFVAWALTEDKPVDQFEKSISELRERGLLGR